MSKFLIEGYPAMFSKQLAVLLGIPEAIFLQELHYWLLIHKEKKENFTEGKYWNHITIKELKKQMPFYSEGTLKNTIKNLKVKNLITIVQHNASKLDHTNYYTLNYPELDKLELPAIGQKLAKRLDRD